VDEGRGYRLGVDGAGTGREEDLDGVYMRTGRKLEDGEGVYREQHDAPRVGNRVLRQKGGSCEEAGTCTVAISGGQCIPARAGGRGGDVRAGSHLKEQGHWRVRDDDVVAAWRRGAKRVAQELPSRGVNVKGLGARWQEDLS
jgi:hypothetical protein